MVLGQETHVGMENVESGVGKVAFLVHSHLSSSKR
jgi:hypothetical protein